jgi:hypothetical protein
MGKTAIENLENVDTMSFLEEMALPKIRLHFTPQFWEVISR